MEIKQIYKYYNKFRYGGEVFHKLMKFRIKNILLVSTFYDAFIFEEDGRLVEQIFGEYHQLNLSLLPEINAVPTGEEAIKKIDENDYDLVITTMRIGEITPFELADKIKEKYPDISIILLLNSRSDIDYINKNKVLLKNIDDVFLWNGDSHIFLSILKYVEDRKNIDYDTKKGLVRVILVVEDNIYYYSKFLPILHKRLIAHTQKLLSEELNDIQKNYRMRTIPKVLLVHNYSDAIKVCEKYKEYLLCVISDIRYPVNDKFDEKAGFKLVNYIKSKKCNFPILLLSSDIKHKNDANKIGVKFIHKYSKSLLSELDDFIKNYLGFGDFIFKMPDGKIIAKASNLAEFEKLLRTVPDESVMYHSKRNDFSAWLIARGEIEVALKIKPITLKDFPGIKEARDFLVNVFKEIRLQKIKGRIVNFDASKEFSDNELMRLSEGSIGGKGRGIAFLNALFTTMELENKFKDIKIKIPFTAFIGTEEFDKFLIENNLKTRLFKNDLEDDQIKKLFLQAKLSEELTEKLKVFIKKITVPIAVRSSGLLEDSVSQPFAGIYQTFMLPNNDNDINIRLNQLKDAIKLVFSSVFLKDAKKYMSKSHFRLEEEKMAVILQPIVGKYHGKRYYPDISGVAQSYNFYPISYIKPEDGSVELAIGLGHWIVSGGKSFRYCPKYPRVLPIAPEDLADNTQREFFALCLDKSRFDLKKGEEATLKKLSIYEAEKDGILEHFVSYWDPMDNRINDGYGNRGVMLLTFPDIIKYNSIPLNEALMHILEIGKIAIGLPVEIEFALNIFEKNNFEIEADLYILQIRPISTFEINSNFEVEEPSKEKHFLYSYKAMGNGIIENIHHIILVIPEIFDNSKTFEIKKEIEQLNQFMEEKNLDYILIGPGRWGSRDQFLGIPIRWADVSKAKVIVELELENFKVDASQGTHFFHNLISSNVGYFYVSLKENKSFIDLDWLKKQKIIKKLQFSAIFEIKNPLIVKMIGKESIAFIKKTY